MKLIKNQIVPSLDYARILGEADQDNLIQSLHQELAQSWFEAYVEATPRRSNVCRFPLGTYEYIYDDLETMEQTGVVPASPDNEGRLVAAVGICKPPITNRSRDDARLRGWLGPTEKRFGKEWDKGHYIAHSLGGAVEQWEANVYPQKRRFNRGWSKAGKRYRQMESFCAANPGILCFCRPFYFTGLARPSVIEFGLLRPDHRWWIEQFNNR